MSKKFTIGVNRAVGVKKQGSDLCITIAEQGTDKSAEFNTKRWVQFVRIFNQIDESLQQIAAKQYVKYCTHIGDLEESGSFPSQRDSRAWTFVSSITILPRDRGLARRESLFVFTNGTR
jgi:hypothetical protein